MSHITSLLHVSDDEEQSFSFAAEFFRRHLTWPNALLNAALERTTSTFYEGVLAMTTSFLQDESSYWLDGSWRPAE